MGFVVIVGEIVVSVEVIVVVFGEILIGNFDLLWCIE